MQVNTEISKETQVVIAKHVICDVFDWKPSYIIKNGSVFDHEEWLCDTYTWKRSVELEDYLLVFLLNRLDEFTCKGEVV